MLSGAIGNGLLVSEGEQWRRQRRLMGPAFHQGELQSYAGVITDLTREAAASWRSGETRNVHEDLMALTLNIVAKLLFGANLAADARDIGTTISSLMEDFSGQLGLRALTPFAHLPTPDTWRIRRGIRRMDRIIYGIIAARRGAADPGNDLLGLLLRARDEDGSRMDDKQLRDEALTLFVAGHETTALALTYALYLLASIPSEQEVLAGELGQVLGGRDADVRRSRALEAHGGRAPGGDAPLSARLEHRSRIAGRRRDRRLPPPKGVDVPHVPVGRAPRSERCSRTPKRFRPAALGRRRAAPPAALRLLSVRRRPAHLHRQPLRDDGSDADPGRAVAALRVRRHAGNRAGPATDRTLRPAPPSTSSSPPADPLPSPPSPVPSPAPRERVRVRVCGIIGPLTPTLSPRGEGENTLALRSPLPLAGEG